MMSGWWRAWWAGVVGGRTPRLWARALALAPQHGRMSCAPMPARTPTRELTPAAHLQSHATANPLPVPLHVRVPLRGCDAVRLPARVLCDLRASLITPSAMAQARMVMRAAGNFRLLLNAKVRVCTSA